MSSKTTVSRRKKIDATRRLVALLSDCLYLEKRSWDRVNLKKYHRMVTELENELKPVNPTFKVTIEGGGKLK